MRAARKQKKAALFKFQPFSKKQRMILNWWTSKSPVKDSNGIIADGAIRSGKTIAMSLSFVLWAMCTFESQNLGMCGKTIGAFRRNVLFWLKLMLRGRGYKVKDHRTDNYVIVTNRKTGNFNYFYIFGGKDERSQDLIQGITLAGVFFDEVALMPESFVNQATGRCSVKGSTFWFNCNPDNPMHWFNVNWIKKCQELKIIYLHFTMDDNLSLDEGVKKRYKSMYAGVFFKRYILGLWVAAEGVIYRLFADDQELFIIDDYPDIKDIAFITIGWDFGGNGSAHAGVCNAVTKDYKNVITIDEEYTKEELTPAELDQVFLNFVIRCMQLYPNKLIDIRVDSAEQVLRRGFQAILLKNRIYMDVNNAKKGSVVDRINFYSALQSVGRYKVMRKCKHVIEAFSNALWKKDLSTDERLDDGSTNIDSLDACEYSTEPYMKDIQDMQ